MWLPNTFSKPSTCWPLLEVLLNVICKPFDLLGLINARDSDQDRLIKTASHKFDLAGRNERTQAVEILGMIFFYPQEKRARVMNRQTNARMTFDEREESFIRILIGALKYRFEVASGLMSVEDQNEMKWLRGWRLGTHIP